MQDFKDKRYTKLLELLDQEVNKGIKFPWFNFNPEKETVSICAWCQTNGVDQKQMENGNKILSKLINQVGLVPSHTICNNCENSFKESKIMFKNLLKLSNKEKRSILAQFNDPTPDYNAKANPPEYNDDDPISQDVGEYEQELNDILGEDIWKSILSPSEYYERHIDEYSARYNEQYSGKDFLSGYYSDLSNAIFDAEEGNFDKSIIKNPQIVVRNINTFKQLENKAEELLHNFSYPLTKDDLSPDRHEDIY